MADTFTKEQRSRIMRQVKGNKNKSTELKLLQFFKDNSITGWRRNYKLFGRPDFVFPLTKRAIFADGCFWHGHNCRNTQPKGNQNYWQQKILRNKMRDRAVNKTLVANGWTVIRIWECELKNESYLKNKLTNKSA